MTDFDMPQTGSWEERGGWVVRRLVAELGLTLDQAAGLVGNLGYESRGFADLQEHKPLVPGSRGGYGWAQWTGPRRRAFETWCAVHNLDPASDEANWRFLAHELRTSYGWFLARLKGTKTLSDACRLVHEHYERPADVLAGTFRSGPDRLRWAERALAGARAGWAAPIVVDIKDAVETLQTRLATAGHYPGPIDGDPGPLTIAALRAWRERR